MKMSSFTLTGIIRIIRRHAVFIALVAGLCFDGWLLWQGWQQWLDLSLPPERVTAKQLQVSEKLRATFIQNIEAYQHPTPNPTVPAVTFQPKSGS